jgi:hypothetical protein
MCGRGSGGGIAGGGRVALPRGVERQLDRSCERHPAGERLRVAVGVAHEAADRVGGEVEVEDQTDVGGWGHVPILSRSHGVRVGRRMPIFSGRHPDVRPGRRLASGPMVRFEPARRPGPAPKGPAGELLERDGELIVLSAAMIAAREGAGRVVVVDGPAGIGKSRLLAEATARGRDAGMRVLAARGIELEREIPFGVAGELFAPSLAEVRG